MTTKEAVAQRILELCSEHNMAINALANISGVAPSTLYSILNEKSQNPGKLTERRGDDALMVILELVEGDAA